MELTIAIDPNDSISKIIAINTPTTNCNCDSIDNVIVPIYMPNEMTLSKLKAKAIKQDSVYQCQLNCLNLNKNINPRNAQGGWGTPRNLNLGFLYEF